jgi:hypothetical protein
MIEIITMLGGSLIGFAFRFMAAQQEALDGALQRSMASQDSADASAAQAAQRGGTWVRRGLALSVVFALIIAPFVLALLGLPTFVEVPAAGWDFLGLFTGGWEKVEGYLVLPEVRQAMLAVIGFYLGSAQVGRR